jgi:hypothetical protein
VILHTCVRKKVFRGKLAAWNLEFCNSCVVLLRNVQVPRRNSDSRLVCCDPSHLRAKNIFRLKLAAWNLEFCNSCVVLLRNVQVPRQNSDSHLVCCDHSHLRAKKTYLEESWRLGTSNSVILASFYFEMCKFHDEIPIRT